MRSPRDLEERRRAWRTYAATEKCKAARRRYNQSSHGKAKNNAQCRRWRRENPEKYAASLRRHDLKRHYSLTPEQWNDLFTAQGSKCAICRSPDPGRKSGEWSTDHCHRTRTVRGIVCNGCNLALGHMKDDPARLRAAAEYLERDYGGT